MKTVFDKTTRNELITRIGTLNPNSMPVWGKMNVYQMLKHCTLAEKLYLGKRQHKRAFIGFLLGKIALKGLLKDENPMRRNSPTSAEFIVKETDGDVLLERQKWITLIEQYEHFSDTEFVHWFFGKMTREQVGYLAYKHIDHHLRQFNS